MSINAEISKIMEWKKAVKTSLKSVRTKPVESADRLRHTHSWHDCTASIGVIYKGAANNQSDDSIYVRCLSGNSTLNQH